LASLMSAAPLTTGAAAQTTARPAMHTAIHPATHTATHALPAPAGDETFRIPVDSTGLRVLVRHVRPTRRGPGTGRAPVLFVHGSSFPSALAAAFRFDGASWMDDLAARGFDVWALDFLGYGGSDRYPEMRDPPTAHPPLGRAPLAARQIAAAAAFIRTHARAARVSIVAHSWGTIPAGLYAGDHPDLVERLVQFGPVARREGPPDTSAVPAYDFVTEQAQRTRFDGYVPRGEPKVLDPRHFAIWGPAYMATDPASGTRSPASVEIPSGPGADIDAAWGGRLPYDPARITAPVLIVRGEWDTVTRDADAKWLYDALSHAALKRDVKIDHATHVMHLEAGRRQLYAEVAAFLAADDTVPARAAASREAR
jgi:pimeloyl-ACP methyl ester carboxylesterase